LFQQSLLFHALKQFGSLSSLPEKCRNDLAMTQAGYFGVEVNHGNVWQE
jgi:hypothetical protein